MPQRRQRVLVLYLGTSALDSKVIAWAHYDGTGQSVSYAGETDEPPYSTGLQALQDGWRLFQVSQLLPPNREAPFDVSYLRYECLFEKLETIDG